MGMGSCTRTRTLQYNMVAQTTLVVFTIVLAATGVFVPEAGRELEENDALISVQNVADVQESGHFVKRDALRDDATGKGKRKLKREIEKYQKLEKEIKVQAKTEIRKKIRRKLQERIRKEEIIRLRDQRSRVVMGMVLKKLKRDRVGKERKINQRKERGLKKENLERKKIRRKLQERIRKEEIIR